MNFGIGLWGITFELTGPLRRDGLARAGKMYRVPQAGPRQPAVGGPVVQRGVRRHGRLNYRTDIWFAAEVTVDELLSALIQFCR